MTLTRNLPLVIDKSALLFIDVQNFCAHRSGSEFANLTQSEFEEQYGWHFEQLAAFVIPNMKKLQIAFRNRGMEVMYTTIESLTQDGRDRSLDYKITGFNVPKGSWDGRVISQIEPKENEIWLPKSSSSVFVSTNIDYILRNLGIKQLVISGLLSDQCVESAIRDACDLGYLITQVTDACASITRERHENSLKAIKGYCRQLTTQQLLQELKDQ